MRVENQVISFNMFKEIHSPSNIDDYYRVNLVNDSIEKNELEEAPLISHEPSVIHPVDEEAKKAIRNTNVIEAPENASMSNSLIEVMESSLSSSNHNNKLYKNDTRNWRAKKKRYGDHHFKPEP
ncbi:hypothetical protein PanWU01x14_020300 [Parasponia andersonii]|uniref:Uncharacterized protein n=1 Tax=Parasponia andersonii TaxID=3476 RepID=A0A2P5DYN6_PARAD|nr:hypothetical protein PanWU01x14_020300 [Parasponia andersonii]